MEPLFFRFSFLSIFYFTYAKKAGGERTITGQKGCRLLTTSLYIIWFCSNFLDKIVSPFFQKLCIPGLIWSFCLEPLWKDNKNYFKFDLCSSNAFLYHVSSLFIELLPINLFYECTICPLTAIVRKNICISEKVSINYEV